ncbi:MFS family permease [Bradyrhizobium sp. USDA 4463]
MSTLPLSEFRTSTLSMNADERKLIIASGAGTVLEWYDFFLYGSLAAVIGAKFFSPFDEATRNIMALLTFATGFLVRPFGALLFGRLGDLVGRKYVFLTTIVVMGVSTLLVGFLPTSDQIGLAAPIILIALRVLQGLAISGEFGGAAVYVAEHAPAHRRGFFAGFIPACIALSLLLTLGIILLIQTALGETEFKAWGWRIPFLASAGLLLVSLWIRLRLDESPAFLKMKADGRQSKAPIKEAFGNWRNGRLALLALFGITTGNAVLGYTGTFYVLVFMNTALKVDSYSANLLFTIPIIFGAMLCLLFAWLSDSIGRKPLIVCSCIVAAFTFFPVFHTITQLANPALYRAQQQIAISVNADPATCSFQFNPAGTAKFTSPCDVAKATLARASAVYTNVSLPPGSNTTVLIAGKTIEPSSNLAAEISKQLTAAGYPEGGHSDTIRLTSAADILQPRTLELMGLILCLVALAQMVQGPAAAAIVELFPTQIRYTGMSLPYQIGVGWIGGLLPATMFAMNAESGDMFFGLWYPIAFAAVTSLVALCFLPETKGRDIS